MSFGKTYNLASGTKTHVWQLIEAQVTTFGHDPKMYPITYTDGTPGDQFGIWADISKIRTDLQWQPSTNLAEGLKQMFEWAQTQI